ncbi:MAG: histidine--tRNA ligase [Eubacterium sp.]|nr:histidine--tRNA ligase [Eubacterium sp.]
MALKKKPVTGMKDISPREMEIRDYVEGVIKDTYRAYGFTPIETPCMESIENLSSRQGGENEKLIFKVLKRGEKLNVAEATTPEEIVDMGLRYDLTVPLVRYYSNHANDLPKPFKALQTGNVWRADRPQKGRYRQFRQCDIDIIGEPTNMAETELILATTETLGKLDFSGFEVRINDRRMLKAMALWAGFKEEDLDGVFIILDKMDKIGEEGVSEELVKFGYSKETADKYLSLFAGLKDKDSIADCVGFLSKELSDQLCDDAALNLSQIAVSVEAAKRADFKLVFDPTLVRGMSYYTGTIFEIAMPQYGGSCGGGGRYDAMVAGFTGQQVPACGFSIGFERIIMLLMDNDFKVPGTSAKKAYLVEKNYPTEKLADVFKQAAAEREEGVSVLVVPMNKNKKFQKEQLKEQGYEDFQEFFNN